MIWALLYIGIGSCLGDGLLSQTALRDNALLLGSLSRAPGNVQWIFPNIEFTCDTVVTSVSYTTTVTIGEQQKHPIFQTWRKSHSSESPTYEQINEATGIPKALGGDDVVNVYLYPDLRWQVQTGDALGAYQPESSESGTYLSFQNGFGSVSYFRKGAVRSVVVSVANEMNDATPLVSIEATGKKSSLFGS